MTQTISLVALILFTALMVFVGISSAKSAKTLDSFLLGGRKVGAWMSAFAYGTSYFSAVIFVGYAGTHGWNIGIGSLWIGIGNAVIGCLLAWKLLARRTRRMTRALSARTMPEFFSARFADKKMKAFVVIVIFVFLVPYAAAVYKGLGALFGAIFPNISDIFWGLSPSTVCMFIVALLTAFYLMLGGYKATVLTDFIQGIIMIVGAVVMVIALLSQPQVGGISGLVSKLSEISKIPGEPAGLTNIFGGDNIRFLMINILLTSFGVWGLPQMMHKFYAVRDDAAIKRGMVISTAFALVIGICAYFAGTMGRLILNNQLPAGGTDSVVPTMLLSAFGPTFWGSVLLAVILLLVLSASMSTLSAIVLTSSSAISVDFVSLLKRPVSQKTQMTLTRVLCLVFVAVSFIFASANITIIVSLMSYAWGVVAGCFIGPFVWGLFKKGITRAGAWAGFLGGFATILTMTLINTFTNPALAEGFYPAFQAASKDAPTYGVCAMAVSFVIVPLVSLFTKKLDPAVVDAAFAETETVKA